MKSSVSAYILLILFAFSACKDNDPAPGTGEKGTLTLHFDNVVGDKDLTLASETYTNASSETFTVTTFRYFISNISLIGTDGEVYTVPRDSSYFLVDESIEESQDILLKNIPAGDYNGVTFTVGVDSLKSVSGIGERKGILDPTATDMYWEWNPGYIFLKLEGTSSAVPNTGMGNMFYYHIGGYGGYDAASKTINNIKKFTMSFGSDKAEVRSTIVPEAHFYVDLLKIFNGTTTLIIASHPMVMFSDYSVNIANNYKGMIEYGHVHNDPKPN